MIAEQIAPEYLTTGEVANRCYVSTNAVRAWMSSGVTIGGTQIKLRCVRLGGRYRTTWEWVEEFRRACEERTRWAQKG